MARINAECDVCRKLFAIGELTDISDPDEPNGGRFLICDDCYRGKPLDRKTTKAYT